LGVSVFYLRYPTDRTNFPYILTNISVSDEPALIYTAGSASPGVPRVTTVAGTFRRGGHMRPRSLDEFLTKSRVPYTTFRHPPAFTAMHAAAVSHIPGRSWAKTVVCVADAEVILAVVPAHYTIELERLRELAGAQALRLAEPREITELYPDCEEGAMPPFGELYLQRVFVDAGFVGDPDFADLARPTVGCFSRPRHVQPES
jgi:Ala-tRNA(Pro) deacylase